MIKKEWRYFVKLAVLLIVLTPFLTSCNTLSPPPKVTKCIINYPKQRLDCINSYGTEFEISMKDKDVDKHICVPGDQFIDMVAWIKEFMTMLTQASKRK